MVTQWSGGGCAGSTTSCTVTMDQNRSVTVTFGPKQNATCTGTRPTNSRIMQDIGASTTSRSW
jgi:hypothetical protein